MELSIRKRHFAHESGFECVQIEAESVWTELVIGKRFDDLPRYADDAIRQIGSWYFAASWNEVYDILGIPGISKRPFTKRLTMLNSLLSREGAAYRFLGSVIVPITNEEELTEIELLYNTPGRLMRRRSTSSKLLTTLLTVAIPMLATQSRKPYPQWNQQLRWRQETLTQTSRKG